MKKYHLSVLIFSLVMFSPISFAETNQTTPIEKSTQASKPISKRLNTGIQHSEHPQAHKPLISRDQPANSPILAENINQITPVMYEQAPHASMPLVTPPITMIFQSLQSR
ncbi:hypothetical protein EC844_103187 [Acinetobacter calcoaceticus]|uniref:Uncharacterized protein n=1 Tax=Acinetobacter calcoaceticus TaxID=471 RepID=A0A4R1Y2D9_ACICA|nr:hypothetical protein EC844_103187 [Acinetobacter calcoaceticus]